MDFQKAASSPAGLAPEEAEPRGGAGSQLWSVGSPPPVDRPHVLTSSCLRPLIRDGVRGTAPSLQMRLDAGLLLLALSRC